MNLSGFSRRGASERELESILLLFCGITFFGAIGDESLGDPSFGRIDFGRGKAKRLSDLKKWPSICIYTDLESGVFVAAKP